MIDEDDVLEALSNVIDPELGLDFVELGLVYGVDPGEWEHVATYPIPQALPATPPGAPLRKPVHVAGSLFVAGDHRDTASLQGALVSGGRAAAAVLTRLGGVADAGSRQAAS